MPLSTEAAVRYTTKSRTIQALRRSGGGDCTPNQLTASMKIADVCCCSMLLPFVDFTCASHGPLRGIERACPSRAASDMQEDATPRKRKQTSMLMWRSHVLRTWFRKIGWQQLYPKAKRTWDQHTYSCRGPSPCETLQNTAKPYPQKNRCLFALGS